ncbi:MAG: M23 family metallopeptidase, partial [Bacteroidales bacterium]|nr:M23 family metallopeptidase [Bacteroidales bacterium]
RDQEIYRNLFKSNPPDIFQDHNISSLYSRIDSTSDITLVHLTTLRNSKMEVLVNNQRKKIDEIFKILDTMKNLTSIPSVLPVSNISPSQAGAGAGRKIHPFYKTPVDHPGLDILSPLGTQVRTAADGVVEDVIKSDRGRGNQITIRHAYGYKTYYAHLGDILVRESQPVKQGAVIGRVGNSGLSFAPHLHYEVTLNGEVLDPVSYFFAELTPGSFREMKINAESNGQSLD